MQNVIVYNTVISLIFLFMYFSMRCAYSKNNVFTVRARSALFGLSRELPFITVIYLFISVIILLITAIDTERSEV